MPIDELLVARVGRGLYCILDAVRKPPPQIFLDGQRSGLEDHSLLPVRESCCQLRRSTDLDWLLGFCTAEGVGSSPIGSTTKTCNLQVNIERPVDAAELIRGLVLQPILQRAHKARVAREHNRAVRVVFRGSVRAMN